MNIQINTDASIEGSETLVATVSSTIEHALVRFREHVTRVEVHLSDENGDKHGKRDKRCMIEARVEGRQPVVVTEQAATLDQAVHGAAKKLVRLLDSSLGSLHEHRKKSPVPTSDEDEDEDAGQA